MLQMCSVLIIQNKLILLIINRMNMECIYLHYYLHQSGYTYLNDENMLNMTTLYTKQYTLIN